MGSLLRLGMIGKKVVFAAGAAAFSAYGVYQWNLASEALSSGEALNDAKLDKIFSEIDTDRSGKIDVAELRVALEKAGINPNTSSVLLKTADVNDDGKLSKAEFRRAMLGKQQQ